MWSRKLLAFQCQRQRQRQQQRKDGCPDGTSTARAGFRFVGLLLAGVWHSLSGDLPPPPPAPAWPRARPENSDAGTDRSCHHCNPGRRPCPLEGASRFFFSSSRPLTPEQTYTSGRTPLGPLPSCHCAVSCLVSPCDSAPKTADCRPPTVDDCRPLAPDPSLARPSLQASKLPWNRQPLDPLIQASCSRPTSPGSNRQPLLPESQPRLGNSSREQSSRLSFFSPSSRDSLSSALRLHYMSPQSLLCPSISRGSRKHASQD